MVELKYKVGDRVRIKSLDWYNENKDKDGQVHCKTCSFVNSMTLYCDRILTIEEKTEDCYGVRENAFIWTDEMIEGLVEEEEIEFTEKDKYWCDIMSESDPTTYVLPQGYQFKDENGNIINATKIVLEKKKKEYPKTYEECAEIITELTGSDCNPKGCMGYMSTQLTVLQKLIICRDAYWKIAGDEMGLGKPWKPSDSDYITGRYCIFVHQGNTICSTPAEDCPFTFPTEEMRDAFYENFKELIESCKELL